MLAIVTQPRTRRPIGLSGAQDAATARSLVTTALSFVPVIGTPLSFGISLISSLMGPGNNYPWVAVETPESLSLAKMGEVNPFARSVQQLTPRQLAAALVQGRAAADYWRGKWSTAGGRLDFTPPARVAPLNPKADLTWATKRDTMNAQAEADYYRTKVQGSVPTPMDFYQAAYDTRHPDPAADSPQTAGLLPVASPSSTAQPFDYAGLFRSFGISPAAPASPQTPARSTVAALSTPVLLIVAGVIVAALLFLL